MRGRCIPTAHRGLSRAGAKSGGTGLAAPARWHAALRRRAAFWPAPANYGFGLKDAGKGGWRPRPTALASEELRSGNSDARRPRAWAAITPFRERRFRL